MMIQPSELRIDPEKPVTSPAVAGALRDAMTLLETARNYEQLGTRYFEGKRRGDAPLGATKEFFVAAGLCFARAAQVFAELGLPGLERESEDDADRCSKAASMYGAAIEHAEEVYGLAKQTWGNRLEPKA